MSVSTLPLWTQWIWWLLAIVVALAGGYAVFFRTIPMLTEMLAIARRTEKKYDEILDRVPAGGPLRPKYRAPVPMNAGANPAAPVQSSAAAPAPAEAKP